MLAALGKHIEPYAYWLMPGPEGGLMRVEDRVLQNVLFLGTVENYIYRPKATAFIASVDSKYGPFLYLVTAEHVIALLKARGHAQVFARINDTNGDTQPPVPIDITAWRFHPDAETDVAVLPFTFQRKAKWLAADTSVFVTIAALEEHEFGIGDEIFAVGLFRHHYGSQKNVPLVRVGTLAALPHEPVRTHWGMIDGYLIELHSIGGLSGSPVYIHRPPVRVKDDKIQYAKGLRYFLLGLISGHFDVEKLDEDSVVDDQDSRGNINTGVAVVVPAHKILETLNQPELIAEREAVINRLMASAAVPDVDISPPSDDASNGNPTHREDFNRLLDAAAQKREQED